MEGVPCLQELMDRIMKRFLAAALVLTTFTESSVTAHAPWTLR